MCVFIFQQPREQDEFCQLVSIFVTSVSLQPLRLPSKDAQKKYYRLPEGRKNPRGRGGNWQNPTFS